MKPFISPISICVFAQTYVCMSCFVAIQIYFFMPLESVLYKLNRLLKIEILEKYVHHVELELDSREEIRIMI